MIAVEPIIASIHATMRSVSLHQDYPNRPGLYAFTLSTGAQLKHFGKGNQIIYVGKAEESLKQRDFNTHFNDKRTGNSTLRRSIGAILKAELEATAFSRNGTLIKSNINHYKFDKKTEDKVSQWMKDNLLIGYWEYNVNNEKDTLREKEIALTIALKPTLDLDKKTQKYNIHAEALTALRQICKDEALQNVIDKIDYF